MGGVRRTPVLYGGVLADRNEMGLANARHRTAGARTETRQSNAEENSKIPNGDLTNPSGRKKPDGRKWHQPRKSELRMRSLATLGITVACAIFQNIGPAGRAEGKVLRNAGVRKGPTSPSGPS